MKKNKKSKWPPRMRGLGATKKIIDHDYLRMYTYHFL
jgi:hypothetical protein